VTLVDTSVWIDHFRTADPELAALLAAGSVRTHPAVIGELAVGNISRRESTLRDLGLLPRVREASHAEVLTLIESRTLHGRGIGWVDMQLLAAALAGGVRLWTHDKRTRAAAVELGIAHPTP
jgi:predicted nucleic acid-binding protein